MPSLPALRSAATRGRPACPHRQQPAPFPRRLEHPQGPRPRRRKRCRRPMSRLSRRSAVRGPLVAFDLADPDRDQRGAWPSSRSERRRRAQLEAEGVPMLDTYREKLMAGSETAAARCGGRPRAASPVAGACGRRAARDLPDGVRASRGRRLVDRGDGGSARYSGGNGEDPVCCARRGGCRKRSRRRSTKR